MKSLCDEKALRKTLPCAQLVPASQRLIAELHVLREMLTHKYGREFTLAIMENKDDCVNERVSSEVCAAVTIVLTLFRPR